jgi:dimethylargininase
LDVIRVHPRVHAITRAVPDTIGGCELTHLERVPIDVCRARAQHEQYERALEALGCTIVRAAAAMDLPDSVFVEDAAVVLDEVAVIARPGAASRRGETAAIAAALARYRPLVALTAPATLDGGDVLAIGRRLFVGIGARTNADGIAQLSDAVGAHGYTVSTVEMRDCLHLKTAVTALSDTAVVLNPAWVDPAVFDGYRRLEVDPAEPYAANVLRIGRSILCAAAAPRTRARLEAEGFGVRTVEVSELAKAEAGVTCCSILVRSSAPD